MKDFEKDCIEKLADIQAKLNLIEKEQQRQLDVYRRLIEWTEDVCFVVKDDSHETLLNEF